MKRDPRVTGAIVAVLIGALLVVALAVARPFGMDPGGFLERWDAIAAGLAMTAVVGWWAGASVVASGWIRAIVVGAAAGMSWVIVAVVVSVASAYVDAVLRGAAGFPDVGPAIIWALYGLVIVMLYGSVVMVPAGIVWGLATRAIHGRITMARSGVGRRALLGLLIVAVASGAAQTTLASTPNARCLDLGGERVLDAAFSPAGDRLATIASNDLNEGATISLLRWPSAQLVDQWRAWGDQYIAVAPDGRVYWSAWEYRDPWRGGVMTAAPGSDPEWLTTGDEAGLWDLTWTVGALRGVTGNGHRVASLPLDGTTEPRLVYTGGNDDGGAFWASPDGRTTVTSPEWSGSGVTVTGPDGSKTDVTVPGDPRSLAMTADGQSLVVADWSGGTRLISIATGHSRPLLRRSQAWIAVSSQGDLAWADDEPVGPGRVCIAPMLVEQSQSARTAAP